MDKRKGKEKKLGCNDYDTELSVFINDWITRIISLQPLQVHYTREKYLEQCYTHAGAKMHLGEWGGVGVGGGGQV